MQSKYVDKIPTIALFLHTQYPWYFKELTEAYGWTDEEIQQAREYLADRGLKPMEEEG